MGYTNPLSKSLLLCLKKFIVAQSPSKYPILERKIVWSQINLNNSFWFSLYLYISFVSYNSSQPINSPLCTIAPIAPLLIGDKLAMLILARKSFGGFFITFATAFLEESVEVKKIIQLSSSFKMRFTGNLLN